MSGRSYLHKIGISVFVQASSLSILIVYEHHEDACLCNKIRLKLLSQFWTRHLELPGVATVVDAFSVDRENLLGWSVCTYLQYCTIRLDTTTVQ